MRSPTELPIAAERDGDTALHAQVASQIRDAIAAGTLAASDRLPATRALARTLGVSRTVISSAYAQLFAEGWIEGRHGSGTYVAEGVPGASFSSHRDGSEVPAGVSVTAETSRPRRLGPYGRVPPPALASPRVPRGRPDHPSPRVPRGRPAHPSPGVSGDSPAWPLIELRPGIPWAAGIDQAAWRRAWRQAGRLPPGDAADGWGLPGLREALTGYLRRSRGLRCLPEQIVVTRGVAASLGLLAATLLRPGDRVGVEEPGYPAARAVFAARGAQVVPCRADRDGLVTEELPDGLRMIYTTPAHQYPLGGRLPVPRRQALVAWARATGALIVEDDYDGEFRYDVAPLPALAGLDPDRVVYLGTTSKTLTPRLATGWLAAPPPLAARLAETAGLLGDRASDGPQAAMLALITSGDLERHIRRMRHEYARRRAAMTGLLGPVAPGRLLGDTAGMHMVLALPGTAPEAAGAADRLAAAAAGRGVAVLTLERYFAGPVTAGGLLLGYGGASLDDVGSGCRVLAELLAG